MKNVLVCCKAFSSVLLFQVLHLSQVYFLFNIWSMDDNVAPPGCPTRQWRLSPGQELGIYRTQHPISHIILFLN